MNQMALPLPVAAQEFFTASELAIAAKTRGIKGFPGSERGVQLLADREQWNDFPAHLARARQTLKAGGRPAMEYHYSILPEVMQRTLHGMAAKARLVLRVADEGEADRRKLAALKGSKLAADARRVMEARAEVLLSIEGYAASCGQTRAWGIARFLDAQQAWQNCQKITARRDAGEILTEREAAALAKRLELISPDGFDLSPQLLALANDRRQENGTVSDRTVRRWFEARDGRGVVALAPVPPRVQQPIPAGFAAFLKFYAQPSKPDATEALKQYLATNPAPGMALTLAQVRHILRNRLNNIEKNVGREGMLTLRSRMAYVTRTTEDMWPTTIYTADGKTFDAEVADPVSRQPMRPEITSVLDVVTRKCVGYAVSRKENVIAVTEALRRSCTSHGICAIFYTDRGAGYKNKTFDADVGGLMGRLGITKMHALPYNSQAKGVIERYNKQLNVLAKRLPSYIGKDMDKEAKGLAHRTSRRELREFGVTRLLPSWTDFIAMLEAMIADYNDTEHQGLPRFEDPVTGRQRHMTPNEAWAAHVADGFEAVTIDKDDVDDLFRPYVIRTARRSQVQWNNNQYFHEALEAWHDVQVMVGHDIHQADKVWVREYDVESAQPGRLICVAQFMGNAARYIPVTMQQKADEDRRREALRRLESKADRKRAEGDAAWLIEQQVEAPADFIDLKPVREPAPVALVTDVASCAPPIQRRRVFASDEDLAAWALNHPGELLPNQIMVLRNCLSRPIGRENLRANGIDTEALRTLLRAAAA